MAETRADKLQDQNAVLLAALKRCELLFKLALPKFNWAESALDANAIRLLNEVPGDVRAAIAKAEGKK